MFCSRTKHSVSAEARTRNPSIPSQALFHRENHFISFVLKSGYWQILMDESDNGFFRVQCLASWSLKCSRSVPGVDVVEYAKPL